MVDLHLNWHNRFHFFIHERGPLVILRDCMIAWLHVTIPWCKKKIFSKWFLAEFFYLYNFTLKKFTFYGCPARCLNYLNSVQICCYKNRFLVGLKRSLNQILCQKVYRYVYRIVFRFQKLFRLVTILQNKKIFQCRKVSTDFSWIQSNCNIFAFENFENFMAREQEKSLFHFILTFCHSSLFL